MELRKKFRPKRDEVTVGWTKRRKKEIYDLYPSPNTIRMIMTKSLRQVWHVARTREKRNAYNILVGKPERKGLFGRPGRRSDDNS